MIKYFTDIYTAASTILGGMSITLTHLLRQEPGLQHCSILKSDGLGQSEISDFHMKVITSLDPGYMLIWMIVLVV